MSTNCQRAAHAFFVFLLAATFTANASDRPNILWITAEDMSPVLGCYGDGQAITPNLDQLAREGVRYTHVFATAPVCSPVRSTLITGRYAPSMGTHNMRSALPLPDGMTGFPSLLKRAGYYTTNNSKTDYNTLDAQRLIEESWDASGPDAHWRDRPKGSPFFAVFNLMTSHQSRSMVWPYEKFQSEVQSRLTPSQIHDPQKIRLPPYYPDSNLIRRDWARFYDCVTAMDAEVGAILNQLRADGLDDNTIVFFYSDHGSGMPRHKRVLLDSGMHVPMIIRTPRPWQTLLQGLPGTSSGQLISFVDLPPTVLQLTAQQKPEWMQGHSFCAGNEARAFAFGHRDRVDEAIDCARSVRDSRFLYIRNFMPHISHHQPTAWPDQGQIRGELSRLTDQQAMTTAQWYYVAPARPREELYDCAADPDNLRNLVDSPGHRNHLTRLRDALHAHLKTTQDLGFVPEVELAEKRGRISANDQADSLADAWSMFDGDATELTTEELTWWKLQSLFLRDRLDQPSETVVRAVMEQSSRRTIPLTIVAADWLVRTERDPSAMNHLIELTRHDDLNIVLQAMRAIELLGDDARSAVPAVKELSKRCTAIQSPSTTATFELTPDQDLAMFISFSTGAFLKRQSEE